MPTTGPSALEIVLWVVLANALLIIFGYGLVQWLRHQTQQTVVKVANQLIDYIERITAVFEFLQRYNGMSWEPFITPISALAQETEGTARRIENLRAANQDLEMQLDVTSPNQFQAIIYAPFIWFGRWRRGAALHKESRVVAARMEGVEKRVQQIHEIPWEIAMQARKIEKEVAEIKQLAHGLRQKGVRGEPLHAVIRQISGFQHSLDQIPLEFLEAEHDALLAHANQDNTIRVYDVLKNMRPGVERWLPLLREWDQQYRKAMEEYQSLQQTTNSLRQVLAHPPRGLQVNPIRERLERVNTMSTSLGEKLAQPEVMELKTLVRESHRLRRLAEDAGQQFSKAGERVSELGQALTELRTNLDALAVQYASLENKESYPIVWDESGSTLANLRQRLQDLGPVDRQRTPEQVKAALQTLAQLRSSYQELAERYPKKAEQYQAIVTLLENPDLQEGAIWVRKTREMIAEAEVYDPKNWQRQDTITHLSNDLNTLAPLQERLVPANRTAPIKESALEQRLKETQQLTAQHKALRPKVENVRARLEKIHAQEDEAKERFDSAKSALEKASILADNNELLQNIAAGEIKRLREDLSTMGNELNQLDEGVMEKKLQRVNLQANAVKQALTNWLARLDAEIGSLARSLSDQLIDLDSITTLEDPPFEEARALLTRGDIQTAIAQAGRAGVDKKSAHKSLLSEQELSAEIKRKNDLWLTIKGAVQAVEEKSAPVQEAYREVIAARSRAQEALAEVSERIPQRRTWPPTNQSPLTESQGLQPVDAKWEAMKKQRARADWAILEMGRLAQQYQSVTERATQVLDRITEDEERVSDLEEQIEDLMQRWLYQAQSNPENPILLQGIQQLLSKTDSQLAYIRQQYMRGAISYNQTLQSLQLLLDEVSSARVPIDESHETGLHNSPRAGGANPTGG